MFSRQSTALLHAALCLVAIGALCTALTARTRRVHLRCGVEERVARSREGCAELLPFVLRLDTFAVERYARSAAARDYRARCRVTDATSRRSATSALSVNHPLAAHGWRLLLDSPDADERGCTLIARFDPWGTAVTYIGYALFLFAAALELVRWCGRRKPSVRRKIIFAAPAFCALCAAVQWWKGTGEVPPVLRSPFLVVHVAVIVAAYALFALVTVMAARALHYIYKGSGHTDKGRNYINKGSGHTDEACVNSARRLLRRCLTLLLPAVLLLAVGVLLGAVWANETWGAYWSWDPKETWALVTLLLYALPLHHGRLQRWCHGRALAVYLLAAFASVLATSLGVALVGGGMHSYV